MGQSPMGGTYATENQAERTGFGPLFRIARDYVALGGEEFADGSNSPFPTEHRAARELHHYWVSGCKAGQREVVRLREEREREAREEGERREEMRKRVTQTSAYARLMLMAADGEWESHATHMRKAMDLAREADRIAGHYVEQAMAPPEVVARELSSKEAALAAAGLREPDEEGDELEAADQ